MRVNIIKKKTVEEYAWNYATSRSSLGEWLTKIKYADWEKPGDIKATFGSADLLGRGSERVVFNIGGNNFRMICKFYFGKKEVHLYVCWIGTHAEYNKLCNDEKQFSINEY